MGINLSPRASRAAALLAAALVLGRPGPAFGHDPGLSSLEVHVTSSGVVATLSLAAADARVLAGTRPELGSVLLDCIEVRIDGVLVPGRVERHAMEDDSGTRVVVAFDRAYGSRLAVRSGVPQRLARGHRQLLTVRGPDGVVLAERMLDGRDNDVDLGLAQHETRITRIMRHDSSAARQFLGLGLRHILSGYDHLLFLGALLLGVRRLSCAVKTVTAFTVAHSVTLAMAVLGLVSVPGAIVEPLIAASIVFVALENLVREQVDSRWKLTFVFGLVHGFGFAGALQELGIGTGGTEIALPLGAFNVGVEAGQIAVVMALWPIIPRLHTLPLSRFRLAPVCSVLVGVSGVYWLVQRTLGSL